MKKNKALCELINRVDTLERELNTLLSALSTQENDKNSSPTYEEVIDLWLNGKSQ